MKRILIPRIRVALFAGCLMLAIHAPLLFAEDSGPHRAYGLYLCNADGSDARRIPLGNMEYEHACIRPDGKRIAYQAHEQRKLLAWNEKSVGPPELPKEPWFGTSERSKWIAQSAPSRTFDIWVADMDGSNQRNLTDNPAYDFRPVWAPDGKRIAFVSTRNGGLRLFVMSADGGEAKQVTPESDGGYVYEDSPSWRGNDTLLYISISIVDNENAALCSVNLNTGKQERIWATKDTLLHVACSPDGKTAALVSTTSPGNDSLGLLDLASLKMEIVYPPEGNRCWCYDPAWSPDGTALLFSAGIVVEVEGAAEEDFAPLICGFRMELMDRKLVQLSHQENPRVYDAEPVMSPDGKEILFSRLPHRPSVPISYALREDRRRELIWLDTVTKGWIIMGRYGELLGPVGPFAADNCFWVVPEGENLRVVTRRLGHEMVIFRVEKGGGISWPSPETKRIEWDCFPDPWPILNKEGVPIMLPPRTHFVKITGVTAPKLIEARKQSLCWLLEMPGGGLFRPHQEEPISPHAVFVHQEADGALRLFKVDKDLLVELATVDATTKAEFTQTGIELFKVSSGFWPFVNETGKTTIPPPGEDLFFSKSTGTAIVMEDGRVFYPPADVF